MTRQLEHENCAARKFYAGLPEKARVGIEATGCTQWFERLLGELGRELWVGDAANQALVRVPAIRLVPANRVHSALLLILRI